MYIYNIMDILIPIEKFSIRDKKILEIIKNERDKLHYQKRFFSNHDTQYRYYLKREYQNAKVGQTAKPINIYKKRLEKNMRYKGFDIKTITNNGKIKLDFT